MRRAHLSPTLIILLLLIAPTIPAAAIGGTLTVEDRVEAQRAIEGVYWRHRIWPSENPTPKPPLAALMPDDLIRTRVEETLSKSVALETLWNRPVTAVQLQAELNRMARNTRNPAMLAEIFEALDNDPILLAESLARPALVDRLIHGWYAGDARFHGSLRAGIQEQLGLVREPWEMKSLGGRYAEVEIMAPPRDGSISPEDVEPHEEGALHPGPGQWQRIVGRLARALEAPGSRSRSMRSLAPGFHRDHRPTVAEDLPLGQISAIVEETDAFSVHAVLSRDDAGMRVATVRWPKRSFDDWWEETRRQLEDDGNGWSESLQQSGGDEAGILEAPSIAAECCAPGDDDIWHPTYTGPPPARSQHTAVWTGTEMITWGGWDGFSYMDSGARYDPALDRWSPTSTGAGLPSGRRAHTAIWTGTEMIVWGGRDASSILDTGGRYSPVTDNWVATATLNGPSQRWGHTAVFTGDQMVVWGGYSGSANLGSGGRYNLTSNSWSSMSEDGAPSARRYHTAVYKDTVGIIVWGGFDNGGVTNTGAIYRPGINDWLRSTRLTGAPPPRRLHTAVGAWTGTFTGHMIVWGGYGGGNLNSGSRYDPWTDTWSGTSDGTGSGVPEARHKHTAVWTGSEMIVWGGSNGSAVLASGGHYSPGTDSWDSTSMVTAPQARWEHSAVWTGTEMLVWGGLISTSYLDSGGRYAPSTKSWVPTSRMGTPEGRLYHTPAWTGTEMIIWGGQGLSGRLETGSCYDPATDDWMPTATGPAGPSPRAEHSTVWTGTEMIVWGGRDPNGLTDTGDCYDPAMDAWTPMDPNVSPPDPRSGHTAVWTGTEMIVWGGSTGSSFLDTGGRYAPAAGSWTPTSPPGTDASARGGHTAVWTGTEMIVWGGQSDGGRLDTGGRYDADSDEWSPLSTIRAPTGRDRHSAVWTGSRMIVWGGMDFLFNLTDTGALYRPLDDTWAPTSVASPTPSARFSQTAVWTGCEMVVWGGVDLAGYTDTGGRFNPRSLTWRATGVGEGTPGGRDHHVAVWTGNEMIVWGGDEGHGPVSSGGTYCVNLDCYWPEGHRERRRPPLRPLPPQEKQH